MFQLQVDLAADELAQRRALLDGRPLHDPVVVEPFAGPLDVRVRHVDAVGLGGGHRMIFSRPGSNSGSSRTVASYVSPSHRIWTEVPASAYSLGT